MKHIHIIEPYHSIAMQRMALPLDELSKLYEITKSEAADIPADLYIHFPYHTLSDEGDPPAGKHIAVYTHCNPGAVHLLQKACERADIVTAMSFEGRRELLAYGVDPKKIWVIYSAADNFVFKRRIVSVVGYHQPNGRKRESLLLDLAWQYDLSAFEFVFAGFQWQGLLEQLASLGVAAKMTDHLDNTQLKTLYQNSDVFLSTGYMEGGPLPLLEAMASGTRVLSPRFGYAADLLDDEDLYTDAADLMEKLNDIASKPVRYHQLARLWSWKDYVAEYALIIGRLLDESVDLYPERGMSRYAQLLDVIDEEKPMSICEIGTWNGNRAIQMLQEAGKYHESRRLSYQGFDLFETMTGEQFTRELSKAAFPESVVRKRIEATDVKVELVKGDTAETIDNMKRHNFYFVDGGHSEETIENDGSRVVSYLHEYNGVALFDDYYHAGKSDGMGCNKFIDGLDVSQFEITHLPAKTMAADGREIGMVKVRRKNADVSVSLSEQSYTYTHSPN